MPTPRTGPTSSPTYGARYAELYDLLYAEKAYASEVAFIAERIAERGLHGPQRLLDVACGTGRHLEAWQSHGHTLTGVDLSAAMIDVARRRVPRAALHVQDMTALAIAPQGFDVAACLFDALGYCVTAEAVLAALRAMRGQLRPGGILVVETWHGSAMLRAGSPVRVRRLARPGAQVLRISETALDVGAQAATVRFSVWEHRDDGTYDAFEEAHRVRYFFPDELRLLLQSAGFADVSLHAGYSDAAVDEDTWHLVAFARAVG